MAKTEPFVTDEQWAKIKPLLPQCKPPPKEGRENKGNREVFEGALVFLYMAMSTTTIQLH